MLIRFFKEIDLIGCGGDTQPIRLHRDCVQGLHAQGWRGHSANQITQGLHARVVHAGVVCKGCTCRDCAQGLRTQGWWGHSANQITQGLCARVAHARVVHTGVARAGVVGTLSQSDYTGVACKGCTCRGCTCRGCTHKGCACRGCTQGLHMQE